MVEDVFFLSTFVVNGVLNCWDELDPKWPTQITDLVHNSPKNPSLMHTSELCKSNSWDNTCGVGPNILAKGY